MDESRTAEDSLLVASLKSQITELSAENDKLKRELAACAAEHDRMTDALEVMIDKYAKLLARTKECKC